MVQKRQVPLMGFSGQLNLPTTHKQHLRKAQALHITGVGIKIIS